MTYNVFGGTLSLTQSINQSSRMQLVPSETEISGCAVYTKRKSLKPATSDLYRT